MTDNPIGPKVQHVLAERRKPRAGLSHTCHWPGCTATVPPAMWGCRKHWFALPTYLRNKVWQTYRPGQEVTKDPGREYVAVAREVQDWITAKIAGAK